LVSLVPGLIEGCGYVCRCKILDLAEPVMVVVDNCCQVRGAISKALPGVHVALDVYHFMMRYVCRVYNNTSTHYTLTRYLIVVINGTKNPHRSEVASDISEAILKTKAGKGVSATYWSKDEQVTRLTAAFDKWAQKGSVW
jgi:hypothetical protein